MNCCYEYFAPYFPFKIYTKKVLNKVKKILKIRIQALVIRS